MIKGIRRGPPVFGAGVSRGEGQGDQDNQNDHGLAMTDKKCFWGSIIDEGRVGSGV